MKDGYIRVCAASFETTLANPKENAKKIKEIISTSYKNNDEILVLPELCLSGYSIEDLFNQNTLLDSCLQELKGIIDYTKGHKEIVTLGLPFSYQNSLYNVVAVISDGSLLGLVPKTHIPNYNEFYEGRRFEQAFEINEEIELFDDVVLFGKNIIFASINNPTFTFGVEICEDLWLPDAPSNLLALNGANLILNSSASNELTSKKDYRRGLVSFQSAKLICGYIYANAGNGESTTDVVFSGHHIISENGTILKESDGYKPSMITAEIDLDKLVSERRKMTTYKSHHDYDYVYFTSDNNDIEITRHYDPHPFVPNDDESRNLRCKEVFDIQIHGLMQRLKATHIKKVVIGISGGLDSTLALLVCSMAYKALNYDSKDIIAVTMPCFGTTSRTKNNALGLMNELKVTSKTVDITKAVEQHFKDINHDASDHDVTYENCQARERTQVLMDLANQEGGIVIGTGDLSEVALGWSTYNGDHMSMYAVNVSVPKTLVRYLVDYVSSLYDGKNLQSILQDILKTPVSPELLPVNNDEITQKTEDIVGPYELHDFFLYHHVRFGDHPAKLVKKTMLAFEDKYDKKTIKKWLKLFYTRFFRQQFKRSCIPDGPKVGTVALSPRGDWRMPSDSDVEIWLDEVDKY